MHMQHLDDACRTHLAHGAMPVGDMLTESLYDALEAPAAEGGQPRTPSPAPLTDAQLRELAEADSLGDWVLWVVYGVAIAALGAHVVSTVLRALPHAAG